MLPGYIAIPGRPSLRLTTLPWHGGEGKPDWKLLEKTQSEENDKSEAQMQ
jgi:hypothetical protein